MSTLRLCHNLFAENYAITPEDLPDALVSAAPASSTEAGDPRHLREVERHHVQAILQQEKGNKVHAARILGISRRTLYRLIEKYRLE